jgi:hypothetical protein
MQYELLRMIDIIQISQEIDEGNHLVEIFLIVFLCIVNDY